MDDAAGLQEIVKREVYNALKANNDELMRNIGQMVDKISVPSSSIVKNVILDKPVFKRRSNEEQFKHNAQVSEKLEDVVSGINSGTLDSAKDALIEAKDLIKKRQKLIQLADKSELGWKVVAEYEANPIASDSEDEKKIYKAEARASRKAKAEKAKKSTKARVWPYKKYGRSDTNTAQRSDGNNSRQRHGLCFICGVAGHWKAECPQQKQLNNKISKSNDILYDMAMSQTQVSTIQYSAGLDIEQTMSCTKNEHRCHVETQVRDNIILEQYEQIDTPSEKSPVGRLKSHVETWKQITEDKYILDVIENGYKLPMKTLPVSTCLKNNKSARDNGTFVKNEIAKLISKGVISELQEMPRVVNPLTVAYNRVGKPRLVLDCRHVNPHLHLFKVRFEDIAIAEQMFEKYSFVFVFDLKSAYHHIDIRYSDRSYLGFSWPSLDGVKYYCFNSLPFGIATAGHIFTKLVKCAIKYWRSLGHKVITFLDDGIGGNSDFKKANESSCFVRNSLLSLGFLIAEEKCCWKPKRKADWLGHTLDFDSNHIYISKERIQKIEASIDSVLYQINKVRTISVRFLASIVGQIVSTIGVIGKIVCLKTRHLHKCIDSRNTWNSKVFISEKVVEELSFWRKYIRIYNEKGKGLNDNEIVDVIIYSDASSVGYGGYIESNSSVLVTSEVVDYDVINSPEMSFVEPVTMILEEGNDQAVSESQIEDNTMSSLVLPVKKATVSYVSSPEVDGDKSRSIPPEVGKSESLTKLPDVSRVQLVSVLPEVNEEGAVSKHPEVCFSQSTNVVDGLNEIVQYVCSREENHFRYQSKVRVQSSKIPLPEKSVCYKVMSPEVDVCDAKTEIIGNSDVIGTWEADEIGKSSTWRELEAVYRILLSNQKVISNKRVKVYTDNKNITYITKSGSNNDELHAVSLRIHEFCEEHRIDLNVSWIPREGNERADHLSKCLDSDDWSVSENVFKNINIKWGPHTIDRFASHYNAKCQRFNSKWWVPGTEAVNSFDQCWSGECNWLVPPPKCIVKCIAKMKSDKGRGTLVIPKWTSAPYWPTLVNENGTFKSFVQDMVCLPMIGTVVPGKGNNGIFGVEPFAFRMLALKCDMNR